MDSLAHEMSNLNLNMPILDPSSFKSFSLGSKNSSMNHHGGQTSDNGKMQLENGMNTGL
jgi:hypothetical protein